MRILQQSAPFSHSLLPLLPAPAPMLMLTAPQLSGLLPAPRPQVIVERNAVRNQRQNSRVFRSIAEWEAADAELAAWIEGAIERINAARQGVYYA